MLTLDIRECTLDDKYSGRRKEQEDQEDRRTLKLGLLSIRIDRNELNALLDQPYAYECLYNREKQPHEPWLRCLKALELADSWEGAFVALFYDNGSRKLVFPKATLSKLKIALGTGGKTSLSCMIEGEPDIDENFGEIIARTGTDIQCEIRAQPPSAQHDLPLSRWGEGEQADAPNMGGARYLNRDRSN
jgi:hypothetical protein